MPSRISPPHAKKLPESLLTVPDVVPLTVISPEMIVKVAVNVTDRGSVGELTFQPPVSVNAPGYGPKAPLWLEGKPLPLIV